MAKSIKMIGQKALEKRIKSMANPSKFFDKDFKKVALGLERKLKIDTPKQTGQTAKAWITKKKGDSYYTITNDVQTQDKKHAVVDILENGHKEIKPKKSSGLLYIPLTPRARAKKLHANIPKHFVRGTPGEVRAGDDYLLVKRVKAVKGKKFIQKDNRAASKDLAKRMRKRIQKGK